MSDEGAITLAWAFGAALVYLVGYLGYLYMRLFLLWCRERKFEHER